MVLQCEMGREASDTGEILLAQTQINLVLSRLRVHSTDSNFNYD